MIVGGDYRKPNQAKGVTGAITSDGGKTWTAVAKALPVRSGGAWGKDRWIAVGTFGLRFFPGRWSDLETARQRKLQQCRLRLDGRRLGRRTERPNRPIHEIAFLESRLIPLSNPAPWSRRRPFGEEREGKRKEDGSMTEAEWLAGQDPEKLYLALRCERDATETARRILVEIGLGQEQYYHDLSANQLATLAVTGIFLNDGLGWLYAAAWAPPVRALTAHQASGTFSTLHALFVLPARKPGDRTERMYSRVRPCCCQPGREFPRRCPHERTRSSGC